MSNKDAAARILAAQSRHCEHTAAELAQARKNGASEAELADLEAQDVAARNRFKELTVDMPRQRNGLASSSSADGRRPWWRIW